MARLTEEELKNILGENYRPGINEGPSVFADLWRRLLRSFSRFRWARQG